MHSDFLAVVFGLAAIWVGARAIDLFLTWAMR